MPLTNSATSFDDPNSLLADEMVDWLLHRTSQRQFVNFGLVLSLFFSHFGDFASRANEKFGDSDMFTPWRWHGDGFEGTFL